MEHREEQGGTYSRTEASATEGAVVAMATEMSAGELAAGKSLFRSGLQLFILSYQSVSKGTLQPGRLLPSC